MPEDPSSKYKQARQIGLLTTIPFLLAVAPLVGYFGGRWLDGKLGTAPVLTFILADDDDRLAHPVLTFVLLGLGFVAGVRETIIVVRKATKEAEDADKGVG